MRVLQSVVHQRVLENQTIVHAGLVSVMFRGYAHAMLKDSSKAVSVLSGVHRISRVPLLRKMVEPYILAHLDVTHNIPSIKGKGKITKFFGNRVAVLKAPAPSGEKGVLFVMFTELLKILPAEMDMKRLLADYSIVIEPSWSGYCQEDFLRLTQFDDDIFVLSAQKDDFNFLKRLNSNLIPIDLGPCDWVDPRVAEPYLENAKEFDIVMNSNWGHWKRHHVLFRMLKRSKQLYKIALIGGSWGGRSVTDIEQLAIHYGVRNQLTIFDNISYEKVMDITCRAKVAVLLSLKEGSNRAMAESMFCNVPVVVLSNHVGGIAKNVVPETGIFARESELESAISKLMNARLQPRRWALDHISCFKSAETLNQFLRDRALEKGMPWKQDLAVRSNRPDTEYVSDDDHDRLAPWNYRLREYLR